VTTANDVYTDLIAEGDALDEFVAGLSPAQWQTQTPAPGWTITHQIAHLALVARLAEAAAGHPDEFRRQAAGASGDFAAA
jgi:enediyne biosynthesis protein E11